jgi:hypothetical protein
MPNRGRRPDVADRRRSRAPLWLLAGALALSVGLKLAVIRVGAPYVSIDDKTTFEGGFLVWFGNSPPQRMFLECWISGLLSLLTFAWKVVTHAVPGALTSNLVADAYRDYYGAPDAYAHVYRHFVLVLDVIAAGLSWRLARLALGEAWRGWAAAIAAAMFMLSYNTIWADLVARPDAMLPLFMTGGLLLYYRSDFGRHRCWLLGAGLVLGLGAGLKLHVAFALAFLAADLVRVHGVRHGLRIGLALVLPAILAFAVSAGIPLFDPLRYVKLRVTNAHDDASPWLRWGDQFVTMLRGSGWLTLPLVLGAILHRGPASFRRTNAVAASLVFQSIGWLLLFASLRVLRAYWMLPALPLFYVSAVGFVVAVSGVRPRWSRFAGAILALVLVVMAGQSWREMNLFRRSDQDGLRSWIVQHVRKDEPFFVFGYGGLILPRSTDCMETIAKGIERGLVADRIAGRPFTERHLRNWEEEIDLVLFDYLGRRFPDGYQYYSYFTTPFGKYDDLVDMASMRYVMVEERFENPPDFPLPAYLADHFRLVAETKGAGGRGYGLHYRIYQRADGNGG